jgi:hypothetical protein
VQIKTLYFIHIKRIAIAFLILSIIGCTNERGELWAEVNDQKLYEFEAEEQMIALHLSPENENEVLNYIDNWIEKQLINEEINLTNPKIYSENIAKTNETLFQLNLFELENIYLQTHIDSTITEKEILEYYKSNRSNYLEKSFIVKALYLKIPDSITQVGKIESAFLLKNDKDREEITKIGNLYATNFYLEEDKWIYFEDLVRDIPITEGVKERLIIKKDHIILNDEHNVYYLNILDYRIKNTTAPLEIEKETIRKTILKTRSNELRLELEKKLIDEIRIKHRVNRYY